MSKASPHLPIEIWQAILRYAISTPTFLDPDAVIGIPFRIVEESWIDWNNVNMYKQAEATRQNLRQVCRSWRLYLHNFENRYVKMIDIRHGEIPPAALKEAIRVSFWGDSCSCDMCCSGYLGPSQEFESFERFCWRIIKEQGPIRAEILDMSAAHFQMGDMVKLTDCLSNLITLSALHCSFNGSMVRLINGIPTLRHCLGRGFWGAEEFEVNRFNSRTLQTLSMSLPTPRLCQSDLSPENWRLPGLRSLRLKDAQPGVDAQELQDVICPLLMAIGRNLIWLDIEFRNSDYEIPSLLWALCPQMEYLNTAMKLSNPPPSDHPIRTLSVPMVYGGEYNVPSGYSSLFPAWPNLDVLMIRGKWSSSSNSLPIYPDWVKKCKQYNIRLVDACNETLESYMRKSRIYFSKSGVRRTIKSRKIREEEAMNIDPAQIPLPDSPQSSSVSAWTEDGPLEWLSRITISDE
ncbi:hypothetical protein CPB86DRAFT_877319 [Serendipita vermifera]|nr:hypothetical protein CPB86DRAFT_877319 [Serendipita vermifera]